MYVVTEVILKSTKAEMDNQKLLKEQFLTTNETEVLNKLNQW